MNGRAFYFCYGSNMLTKRMLINIKSAVKHTNGVLKSYKFGFSGYSNLWKGSTANIEPQQDSIVWGVIWTVTEPDLELLDKQEIGYNAINVDIHVENGPEVVSCRTYVQKPEYKITEPMNSSFDSSVSMGSDVETVIKYCIPSAAYKLVCLNGAVEQNLPQDYIDRNMRSHPDNNQINCGPPGLL